MELRRIGRMMSTGGLSEIFPKHEQDLREQSLEREHREDVSRLETVGKVISSGGLSLVLPKQAPDEPTSPPTLSS